MLRILAITEPAYRTLDTLRAAQMSGEKWRVLIAEDNRAMSHVMRFNLIRAGMDVRVAATGTLALETFFAEHFDLLLTDFQMPGINGAELCRAVRAGQHNRSIPIILISAKVYELDTNALREELSLSKLLYKPFSPREIVESAQALLTSGARLSAKV